MRVAFVPILLLFVASIDAAADDFIFEGAEPKFKVTIPNIPQMKMGVHPLNKAQAHQRYLGEDGPYTVSILIPTADPGITAVECASSVVRSIAQSGIVPPSQIYRARLNENTFVMIYAVPQAGFVQLHAHFLSAVGGTHCINVHASKASTSKDDLDPWFKGFGAAKIEAN